MAIVCDAPFEVFFIINPNTAKKKVVINPWIVRSIPDEEANSWASIEENDEIDLYFTCEDANARLYLDALECCPPCSRIHVDAEGLVYCTPGSEAILLYRSDSNYDALRVDMLQLTLIAAENTYYSFINVIPKQLTLGEWENMRDSLEREVKGLAQDIVRRNIGVGSASPGIIPPDDLYAFLIINKYSKEIASALSDIKDRPKYKLQKKYQEVEESKAKAIDTETVKRYLRKGAVDQTLIVPTREVVYDIQENRLLKKIIKAYDEKLHHFIRIISASLEYRRQQLSKYPQRSLYEEKYISGLESYLEAAQKLQKATNIIKATEWFNEVHMPQESSIPHSFAIDSRYGTLYRLYSEIKKQSFEVEMDPMYSYSWKKSSILYEMWCYITVCRYMLKEYALRNSEIESIFFRDHLFPFLKSGTKLSFENHELIVDVVYDTVLPRKSKKAKMFRSPLYLTGSHIRPDICINLYSKQSGWYIGSFVIECKYRNLFSFWYGKTWSSRDQIKAYHNDSASPLLYDDVLGSLSPRPILKVLVFTPDVFDTVDYDDEHVSLYSFKPPKDSSTHSLAGESLLSLMRDAVKNADQLYNQFQR